MFNLKKGTLKFLLNSSIDTLPTQANLKRWKKSTSDACKLCGGRQTSNHILNICKVGLDTGRYTWRHNNIVNYVISCIDNDKYTVYSDLPGHTAPGGGSLPPHICVTPLKPDIVIIDEKTKICHIFELTVPSFENIDVRNQQKSNKYAHFLTDLSGYKGTVTCFEICSRGYICDRNNSHLKVLHSFVKSDIKLKLFKENISALSIYSSYHIYLCRNEQSFIEPPFFLPPLKNHS